MTADKRFKRRVRARAARTGESYASARRHLSNREDFRVTNSVTSDNPIDRGLAECVAAFVLERHDTVIGASAAATLASARRGPKPPEAVGEALTVTGADPGSGAARSVVVDHLELSRYVDEKVQQSNTSDDARAVLSEARDRAQSFHRERSGR